MYQNVEHRTLSDTTMWIGIMLVSLMLVLLACALLLGLYMVEQPPVPPGGIMRL